MPTGTATIALTATPAIATAAIPNVARSVLPSTAQSLDGKLLNVDDLGALTTTQQDGDGGNPWGNGLCGASTGPLHIQRFSRRFVERSGDLDRAPVYAGYLVESILVFSPGDAETFMTALVTDATMCSAQLQTSGHALFGGGKQLPRIRNEARTYTVESFGCCATPRADDDVRPHDIVFIRDGDLIILLYDTAGLIERAARIAEDRIDGITRDYAN